MGWSFRKSIKLGGGVRLNLSKRGLGLSFGTKGARVSMGPSGNRFYSSIGPFRYQSPLNRVWGGTPQGSTSNAKGCGCVPLLALLFGMVLGVPIISSCGDRKNRSEPAKPTVASTPQQFTGAGGDFTSPEEKPSAVLPLAKQEPKPVQVVQSAQPTPEADELDPTPAKRQTVRHWQDSTGKFGVDAVLIGFARDVAYVQKEDGDVRPVPMARLSGPDRSHVQNSVNVIEGRVVGITDGDTITVLDANNKQHKIRLEGIDSPENSQPYGDQARRALGKLVFQKNVRIDWMERDKYGRILGHVYADDHWVNLEMVEGGWAWHFIKYNSMEALAEAQKKALYIGQGLWAGKSPMPPWDYREQERERAKEKAALAAAEKPKPPVTKPTQPTYVPSPSTYVSSGSSSSSRSSGGNVYVRGYTRKDGTYVAPHTRSSPRR